MSFEQSLIARAVPRYAASRASAILDYEVCKGCSGVLYREPVALEPRYDPIAGWSRADPPRDRATALPDTPAAAGERCRFRIGLAPREGVSPQRVERFLKQLQGLRRRVAFEIHGSRAYIALDLVTHRDDTPLVRAAFAGEFPELAIAPLDAADVPLSEPPYTLRDFYPPPPYIHLLTQLTEIRYSPYDVFFAALESLEPPAGALLQVLFQPVSKEHDWHRNVAVLQDIEYGMRLQAVPQAPYRAAQQAPSGELHHMASELAIKAHDDKPFFAVALRLLAAGPGSELAMDGLSAFAGLFQHGGRPLNQLHEGAYEPIARGAALRELVARGLALRPGMILNTWELSGLCHLPPPETIERHAARFPTLPLAPAHPEPAAGGIVLGTSGWEGCTLPVCVSPACENSNMHVIGGPGTGKTTLMESMALQDARRGHGVILLDPHGDLAERFLGLLREEDVERVVYADPGNPDWVLLWNLVDLDEEQDARRTASELVGALRSSMDGWGDRLGHILENTFQALLELPDTTLLDATEVLRKGSSKGETIRKRILASVKDPLTLQFWREQFPRYNNADLAPPQHKLGQFFSARSAAMMCSQPQNRLNLQHVLERQQILVVDLSRLGSDTRNLVGAVMLAQIHMATLARSCQPPGQRKRVTVYCDEAHRFTTDALEDLLNEGRKYNVLFRLAHQQKSQMTAKKASALAGAGITVAFRVGEQDAGFLARGFMGKVDATDIMALPDHEAVVRMHGEVVSIRTLPPRDELRPEVRERILKYSRERYHVPVADDGRRGRVPAYLGAAPVDDEEAYRFDEF